MGLSEREEVVRDTVVSGCVGSLQSAITLK